MRPITSRQDLIEKTAKKLIPLHCLFELTYKCNIKCCHCCVLKERKKELNKWEIFKILEQLKDAGCLYLTFSGGEILVRKDFFEIAEYARKLNFAIRLFTNGMLINGKIADRIKTVKPLAVEISLYGFKNTHEKITQAKGSFDRTVQAIKLLRKRGIKVFTKTVILRQNSDEIWELEKFVRLELKAHWRGIGGGLFISPCNDGDKRPLNHRLTDMQMKRYIKEQLLRFKSINIKDIRRKVHGSEMICKVGLSTCNITPYGEVNPCAQIKLEKNNTLKNKSLLDIWRENEEIKKLRNLCMRDKKECWDCNLISYCVSCPGIALLECGSVLAKLPEACRQARIRREVHEELLEQSYGRKK